MGTKAKAGGEGLSQAFVLCKTNHRTSCYVGRGKIHKLVVNTRAKKRELA